MSEPDFGRASFVLHEKSRRHFWQGVGPLSIKAFFGGRALYASGPGRYAVDDACYLVLNDGQPYSVAIEAPRPVESLCIFFAPGMAADVARDLEETRPERLLDDPCRPAAPVRFFERTYPHDRLVSPALQRLRAATPVGLSTRQDLDEPLHALLEALLRTQGLRAREPRRLPALRASTREELYRRLHRARDYVAACYDERLQLEDLARVACLSPNHLLRTFKQLFGCTPHQWLTAVRLDHARRLLAAPEASVTEVCMAVGFESLASFSRLFRRHVGAAPDAYRRKVISDKRRSGEVADNLLVRLTAEETR
jgi:AraC-like DNA-binding protein